MSNKQIIKQNKMGKEINIFYWIKENWCLTLKSYIDEENTERKALGYQGSTYQTCHLCGWKYMIKSKLLDEHKQK